MFSVLSLISFFYFVFCLFHMIDLSFCCFRIPVDACLLWLMMMAVLVFGPSLLAVCQVFYLFSLPISCLCFKSLWLLNLCWSVRECWLYTVVSLWLYVLCVQVPETCVSLVLVVGLCYFWLLFAGHVRRLLLELILIFDFTVQIKPSVESFCWREKVSSWVGLALAHELFVILIFLSEKNRERERLGDWENR